MPLNTLYIAESHNGSKVSLHGDMDVAFNDPLPRNFSIALFTSTAELFQLTSSRYQFRDFAGNLVSSVPFGGKPGLFVELTLDLDSGIFYATANNVVSLATSTGGGTGAPRITEINVASSFPALDAAQTDVFNINLANPASLVVPAMINGVVAKTYTFYFQQDTTGSRLLTFDSKYKFPNGRAPVMSTLPGTIDIVRVTPRTATHLLAEVVTGYSTQPVAQVGTEQYDLMSSAAAAAPDGGIITVLRTANLQEALASFTTDKAIAVIGKPGTKPALNVDGTIRLSFGKATLNPEFGELYIRDLVLTGAAVPATGNGAGIRFNPGTRYLQVDSSTFRGNENGILSGASGPDTEVPKDVFSIVIQDSLFDNNGHSTNHKGYTHNVYLGSIQRAYAIRSRFINSEYGHDFKSRAQQNLIDRCYFEGAKNGRAFDIPNGGVTHAVNSYFRKLPDANQSNLIGIGQESYYAGREQQYIFRNCLFENLKSSNYHLSFINQIEGAGVPPVYFIDCVFLDNYDGKTYNVCEAIHIHTGGPLGPEGYTGPTGFIPRRFRYNPAVEGEHSIHAVQPVLINGPDPTLEWFPPTNSPATNPNAPLPATVLVATSSRKNYPGTDAGAGGKPLPPPPADETPPTVSMTTSSTEMTVEGPFTINATASDNRGVKHVIFKRNDEVIATDTSVPYSVTIELGYYDNGTHVFTATAVDAAGNIAVSDPVTVTVNIPEPIEIDPNITMDDATRSEYDIAINSAEVGSKRVAGAQAVRDAMRPDYRLYIYQNNTLVIPVEYTGDMVITDSGGEVYLSLGAPDSADPLVSADLNAGTWHFKLQGGDNYGRLLSGSVGPVGSGAHLELDNNPEPGTGFDQDVRFILPASLDGQ